MLAVITGANGFIGRHLARKLLARGDKVRILTRQDGHEWESGLDVVVGDLTQEGEYLNKLVDGADVLYHCAGEISDEGEMHALHVDGTNRLADAAKGKICRWVQLSSVGAYGQHQNGVITEQTPELPENTYEITKTESDEIVRKSGIPFVILRPSIVFGEGMTNQSLFQMVRVIRKGLFFYIGSPGAMANYVHVDDVVDALCKCADNSRAVGKTFNLSQSISMESMVEALMMECSHVKRPRRFPLLPVYIMTLLLGWVPKFPLTQARIAALTSRCRYVSDAIMHDLGFEFEDTLENRFRIFGSKVDR